MTAFYHTPGVDRASLLAGYRDVLLGYLNPRPGVVLTGFKETHWQWKEGLRDARLLLEAFPCAKLVLNWRQDVAAQLDSQHAHPRVVKDLPKDMEARNKARPGAGRGGRRG